MRKINSKTIISTGFLTILLIIVIFLVVWMDTIAKNKVHLEDVRSNQKIIHILTALSQDLTAKTTTIHRIVEETNKQKRQEYFSKLDAVNASVGMLLVKLETESSHLPIWSEVKMLQNEYSTAATHVVNLSNNEKVIAEHLMFEQLSMLQENLFHKLQLILTDLNGLASDAVESALTRNKSVFYLITMLGAAAILLGFLSIFVLRLNNKSESALMEQGKRIRMLYEITSKSGLSTEEQIREILKLGCNLLEMQIGKVCKINREKNTNSFLNVYAPEGFGVCAGTVMPLDKTFCSITTSNDEMLALHNVEKSRYGKQFSHLSAYIATEINVNDKQYGTVNFSSNLSRQTEFTETDKDLVKLIGTWVSSALEQRFSQEDLLIARNQAEAASRTKSAFLANMSHELRTPLNAIIGYTELIKEEAAYNGHHEYDSDLHKVNSSALHLLALIDDILDLSKIEAGKMEIYLERFSIKKLLEEVAEVVIPLMSKKNNTFELNIADDIGEMYADRMKVKQVLFNLLSNASKFTEEGQVSLEGKINQVSDGEDTRREVVFIVKDTGIGINDEQISKIFQAFSQADASTTSKFGGTGLGLAISRQICQIMGGDIVVKGALGQGTTFIVSLAQELNLNGITSH